MQTLNFEPYLKKIRKKIAFHDHRRENNNLATIRNSTMITITVKQIHVIFIFGILKVFFKLLILYDFKISRHHMFEPLSIM
jgi:hypothetical protein